MRIGLHGGGWGLVVYRLGKRVGEAGCGSGPCPCGFVGMVGDSLALCRRGRLRIGLHGGGWGSVAYRLGKRVGGGSDIHGRMRLELVEEYAVGV